MILDTLTTESTAPQLISCALATRPGAIGRFDLGASTSRICELLEYAPTDALLSRIERFLEQPALMDSGADGSETRSARQLLSIPGVIVEGGDEFLGWLDVKHLGENVLSAVSALREFITDASIRVAPAGPNQEFGRHVLINVSSAADPEEFIDELDRFDDEWWCEQPASVTAPLGIYLG